METMHHMSLEAKISSLYAPEIRFIAHGPSLIGKTFKISGAINSHPILIIQASGCSPHDNKRLLRVDNADFSFILAWKDAVNENNSSIWLNLASLFDVGIYPFESNLIELNFSGVDFCLITSFHIELPHFITRYEKDTMNLQHVFSEGLRAPSYMGGIVKDNESLMMHLRYKPFNAFRRISFPILTMVSVLYLDLAALLAGGSNWRNKPAFVFAVLCINTAAFGNLAAISVGSTTKSLLNLVRFLAVLWIIALTMTIRTGGVPIIEYIIDAGLKGCVLWLLFTACFSFVTYSFERSNMKRKSIFWVLLIFVAFIWLFSCFFLDPLFTAVQFAKAVNI